VTPFDQSPDRVPHLRRGIIAAKMAIFAAAKIQTLTIPRNWPAQSAISTTKLLTPTAILKLGTRKRSPATAGLPHLSRYKTEVPT
jgi:hypothetical protein